MKKGVLCVVILALLIGIGNKIPVNAHEARAEESSALQEAISNLENGYAEYYNILGAEKTLCCSHEIDGVIENTYLLEMKVVLKADCVEKMDYFQGVVEYCEDTEKTLKKMKAADACLYMEALYSEQTDIYEKLNEYVGAEQILPFYIKEIYTVNQEADTKIMFENGTEYVSWEEMLPATHVEQQKNGYNRMVSEDTMSLYTGERATIQRTASYTYEPAEAIAYMTRFTSNPSSCNACGNTSCGYYVDTTKYNSSYGNYASTHNDCANFLSQALCEGGIPEDSTWKAGSNTWVGVSKLTTYMTSSGYWTSVNYSSLQKGDILSSTKGSHVMMITSFDGTTYRYSAHTNDRKNYTISLNSSSPYKFYRVR